MRWHKQRLTMTLQDGRTLAWYEFGSPHGAPCIYTTGTPASGWGGSYFDEPAKRAGVRWISVDKPGYGGSDYQPRRRLLDWSNDISQLADHLKLDQFSVAGQSGGGPHALALCYALANRVSKCVILAGMEPVDDGSLIESMKPGNRLLFRIARHAPFLLWPLFASQKPAMMKLVDPECDWEALKNKLPDLPPSDLVAWERKDLREIMYASQIDAFSQGLGGAIQDLLVCVRPWGFQLSEIRVPVEMWHGVEDRNVPIAIARKAAGQISSCTLHEIPSAGHLLTPECLEEAIAALGLA